MKRKTAPYKYLIAALVLILVAGFFVMRSRRAASTPVSLQTGTVDRGEVLSSVSASGTLEAVTTVEVKSNVGGQVIVLAVDEGDHVKAGQLIAKIDPSDTVSALHQSEAEYESARSQVEAARQSLRLQQLQTTASVKSAEESLKSSRSKLRQAEYEARVQPTLTKQSISSAQSSLNSALSSLSETKNASAPQLIASAKASYDSAKASYDKAERDLARQRALLEKGFVSKSAVDSSEATYLSTKATLASAKETLSTVEGQASDKIKAAEAAVAQARASLETARTNAVNDDLKKEELAAARASVQASVASLETARASLYADKVKRESVVQTEASLQKAKASLGQAQTDVGYTTITAPRDGVIVEKSVEQGSIVSSSAQAGSGSGVTLVEIADVSKMRVSVAVDETDIGKIQMGQLVDVSVDAFPDDVFTGKVTKIAPMASVTSNVTTISVTVELDGSDSRLRPTMNATCDFVVSKKENVLRAPVDAFIQSDNGMLVTVLDKDGKQVERSVEVGLTGDEYCEVKSGLSAGDTVVIPEDTSTTKKSSGMGGPGGGGPPGM